MTIPACKDCKSCVLTQSKSLNEARCSAVTDPLTGASMPLPQARMDTWNGYNLACGYKGALFS